MKQFLSLLTAGALLVSLAGCKAAQTPSAEVPETTIAESTAPVEITVTVPAATKPVMDEAQRRRLTAYQNVLHLLTEEHQTPEGEEVFFDVSFGDMMDNTFAIFDADSDGEDELVIWLTAAPMAGMRGWVYGYDAETDSVYTELSTFPALEFFTGGLVKCLTSHNQGLASGTESDFWPYTLVGYNPATRTYDEIAYVDGWSKASHPTDWDGNPYPDDIDVENDGMVYLVTQGLGREAYIDTLSQEAYDAWYAALFGSSTKIPVEPLKLTQENIAAIV